jgi:hypothetical protein
MKGCPDVPNGTRKAYIYKGWLCPSSYPHIPLSSSTRTGHTHYPIIALQDLLSFQRLMNRPEPANPRPRSEYAPLTRIKIFWDPTGRAVGAEVLEQLRLRLSAIEPCAGDGDYSNIHAALVKYRDTWEKARNQAENAFDEDDEYGKFIQNEWAKRCMESLQEFHAELCAQCETGSACNDGSANGALIGRFTTGLAWALTSLDKLPASQQMSNEDGITSTPDLLETVRDHVERAFHGATFNPQAIPESQQTESQSSSCGTSRPGSPMFSEHSVASIDSADVS